MYVSGDIFTIEPTTQYVWINHNATFECAIIDINVTLGFSVSKNTSAVTTVTDLPEGGQLATASFTVTSDNNGTSVRCIADDGTIFTRSTLVYAYAQGKW